MLLQLSEDHGLNTDTITIWAVEKGLVTVQFSTGDNVTLDCDEGLEFLQYVTYSSPALEVDTRNRLFGQGESSEQQSNAE